MRNMLLLFLSVIMLMTIAGCWGRPYAGTWGQPGTGNTVLFNSDGTGYINSSGSDSILFNWINENGEAIITVDGSEDKMKCSIDGDGHLLIFTSLDATTPSQVADRIK